MHTDLLPSIISAQKRMTLEKTNALCFAPNLNHPYLVSKFGFIVAFKLYQIIDLFWYHLK